MGGQYFFAGDRSSLGANASLMAAPVMRKSDQWSFVPIYSGTYQGTKGVNEGSAAGTIFQQKMDHWVSFSAIDSLPGTNWKLKPSVSYKRQFLKETRDESWGHGLFDFEKIALGLEAENVYRDPFSYRLGLDVFRIRFPNFQSLESKTGIDPAGNPLGREHAGKNVLDTYNYNFSFGGAVPIPFNDPVVSLQGGYNVLYQDYISEPIVDSRGQLETKHRNDLLQNLSVAVGYPRPLRVMGTDCRLDLSFAMNLSYNKSNQNTFDANQTKFIADFYSYYSFGLGPSAALVWGDKKRPSSVSSSFRFNKTRYLGRQAQEGEGIYTGSLQTQDRYSFGIDYSYPIAPSFSLKAQTNAMWVRSNNNFEKRYSYNYVTQNYLLGFTYEY
jgi:hypothetical protein